MRLFWYRAFPRLTFIARRLAGANYEREMELLDVLCDRGRVSVDVGAKIGMYTHRLLRFSAGVVVFEPNPVFHGMLSQVFASPRARVERCALSSSDGSAVMRMPFDRAGRPEWGRSTIEVKNSLTHEVVARIQEIEVATRRLDRYRLCAGFIKIDVEGHELEVLAGAEETIVSQRPTLLVECNDDHHPGGVGKLAEWFQAHDYTAHFMSGRELLGIEHYDRKRHWEGSFIENFIGIHNSRPDVKERLVARVRTARMTAVAR